MDQQIASHTKVPAVVMLALARHDGPYASTAWSLAQAFALERRVFYIDNPFTLSDFFKKNKKEQVRKRYTFWLRRKNVLIRPDEKQPGLVVMVPPLMLPVNWLPPGRLYRFFSGINRWLLGRSLKEGLQQEGLKDFIFLNSFNPFYGSKPPAKLEPLQYIYQTVDAIAESNYIGKHGPRLEREAMQEADVSVGTSAALCRQAARWSKRTVYIPNAADIDLFRQALEKRLPKPKELQGEQRSVICYTGHIDHRLDYSVLNAAARQHKDKLFLMIGPVSGKEVESSGFAGLPNVHFTGKKPLKELPAYLQHVQATLIPFKCNELCRGIYPLKLNEYLAAGKAVVATPFSEDIEAFRECIYLAEGPEDFSRALEEALAADSTEKRKERLRQAEKNSWGARAAAFRILFDSEGRELKENNRTKRYEKAVK